MKKWRAPPGKAGIGIMWRTVVTPGMVWSKAAGSAPGFAAAREAAATGAGGAEFPRPQPEGTMLSVRMPAMTTRFMTGVALVLAASACAPAPRPLERHE